MRNCQTIFHTSCTILYFHQQCTRVPFSPHPHQHVLFSILLILPITVSVKLHLIVVLICISLITNDVEHLFMCLMAIIYMSSFEKCLLKSFACYLIALFVFSLLSCKSSFYVLDSRPLSDMVFKYVLPFCGLSFHFLRVFF